MDGRDDGEQDCLCLQASMYRAARYLDAGSLNDIAGEYLFISARVRSCCGRVHRGYRQIAVGIRDAVDSPQFTTYRSKSSDTPCPTPAHAAPPRPDHTNSLVHEPINHTLSLARRDCNKIKYFFKYNI